MEVAAYFRLTDNKAGKIIKEVSATVKAWKKIAAKNKISNAEQERMAAAFT